MICLVILYSPKRLASKRLVFASIENPLANAYEVTNDVKITAGSLIFEDGASLVQTNDAAVNSGNITYKRKTTALKRYDYTYWSSPVSGQFLLNFSPLSPANLFLQFNSATNSWQYITSPGTTSMIPGKGYIFRAPTTYPTGAPATPQVYVASFIGVPNTGTITIIPTEGER